MAGRVENLVRELIETLLERTKLGTSPWVKVPGVTNQFWTTMGQSGRITIYCGADVLPQKKDTSGARIMLGDEQLWSGTSPDVLELHSAAILRWEADKVARHEAALVEAINRP